ncbi:MAG: acyltransferase [Promethearchaeota archaeon]
MKRFQKLIRKVFHSLSKLPIFSSKFRVYFLRCCGVKIGRDTTINHLFTVSCDLGYEENLVIEDRVAFGPNVTLILNSYPNNSKLRDFKDKYPFLERNGNILIKHDAWIGAGSIILPNITVGEYSVVGAGSVVTKDVCPYTVVVGVPAKRINTINLEVCDENIS